MPSPWEKYQKTEEGPWAKYKTSLSEETVKRIPVQTASEKLTGKIGEAMDVAGRGILTAAGKASEAIDSITGAPIRSGIGALQEGKGIGGALKIAGKQFLSDPSTAPTGKELAERAGISVEEFETPLIANPFTGEKVKVSPAGLVGGVAEAALDPLTYVGLPEAALAKPILKSAATKTAKLGEYLGKIAEERAVKAATGQNLKQIKKFAKVAGERPGDISRAEKNLRKAGRDILEEEDLLKPWSTSESLGPKMGVAAEKYGKQIGNIAEKIDKIAPGSVSGERIGEKILEYASTIPETPQNQGLIDGLLEQAQFFSGRKPKMDLSEAQKLKSQYSFKNVPRDAKISNQDAINKINQFISEEMETGVENVSKANPTLPTFKSFKEAKSKYGSFVPGEDATTERMLKNLSNRAISPSDYAAGGIGAIAAGQQGGATAAQAGITGALAAALNNQIRARGNAFIAKSFDKLSKIFYKTPEKLGKYEAVWKNAIRAGGGTPTLYHKMLLNNDPEYQAMVLGLDKED